MKCQGVYLSALIDWIGIFVHFRPFDHAVGPWKLTLLHIVVATIRRRVIKTHAWRSNLIVSLGAVLMHANIFTYLFSRNFARIAMGQFVIVAPGTITG